MAEHTNGTIGALLNATFGNAPELLIATAALRSGFYRVVQLAMLGSMLTNLLFVFGLSCLVGGVRWQVQELRITSGNVSVLMLLLSTAGSLLPATLILGKQMKNDENDLEVSNSNQILKPTVEELQFCRVNAFVMIFMYGCYLIFQLGTHKEEFDEEEVVVQTANDNQLHLSPHFTSRHGRQSKARRNLFCMGVFRRALSMRVCNRLCHRGLVDGDGWIASPNLVSMSGAGDLELARKNTDDDQQESHIKIPPVKVKMIVVLMKVMYCCRKMKVYAMTMTMPMDTLMIMRRNYVRIAIWMIPPRDYDGLLAVVAITITVAALMLSLHYELHGQL